jgi:hypothetical protein
MLVWFYVVWCYLLAKQSARKTASALCGSEMQLVAITDGSGALLYIVGSSLVTSARDQVKPILDMVANQGTSQPTVS